MIAYRPTADLDDDLNLPPALWGDDDIGPDNDPDPDYVPEPYLLDLTVMLISSDPTCTEPEYATVPGILTGTGPKEWR